MLKKNHAHTTSSSAARTIYIILYLLHTATLNRGIGGYYYIHFVYLPSISGRMCCGTAGTSNELQHCVYDASPKFFYIIYYYYYHLFTCLPPPLSRATTPGRAVGTCSCMPVYTTTGIYLPYFHYLSYIFYTYSCSTQRRLQQQHSPQFGVPPQSSIVTRQSARAPHRSNAYPSVLI